MRGIYMAAKMSLGVNNPYGNLREPLKKELIEMLLKKQAVIIKENKLENDLDLCEQEEEMRPSLPPEPKLGHLIAILKKTGITFEQIGDKMGLSFLGNIICQYKQFNLGSCNYVCFLYNYFQKVSASDWPGKMQYLKSSRKVCRRWNKPEIKPKKVSTNGGWLQTSCRIKQQLSLMFFYHRQCGLKNAVLSFEK